MRGKLAKQIRKAVYGNTAQRGTRMQQPLPNGMIVNVGVRRSYLYAKEQLKRLKRRKGYDVARLSE